MATLASANLTVEMKLHILREAAYSAVDILDRIVRDAQDPVIRELARDAVSPLRNAVHR